MCAADRILSESTADLFVVSGRTNGRIEENQQLLIEYLQEEIKAQIARNLTDGFDGFLLGCSHLIASSRAMRFRDDASDNLDRCL